MRHGFTLAEILMVLAILGLALGIAVPKAAALRDSLVVEQEAYRIVAAHRRARAFAIARGRTAVLSVGPAAMAIRIATEPGDIWVSAGPALAGVALAGPVRRMTFSPVGYTTGLSNATFRLSRGTAHRSVVVSRLGRVRVTRP